LKNAFPAFAHKIPSRELPNWLVRVASLRDANLRPLLSELGTKKNATNEKAKRLLGWAPRSNAESVAATGESLVRLGLVKAA